MLRCMMIRAYDVMEYTRCMIKDAMIRFMVGFVCEHDRCMVRDV